MSDLRLTSTAGSRPAWVALGMIGGLALAVALGPALAPRSTRAVDDTTPDRTISVSGTGTVTLVPDVADVHVGVDIQRPTVKAARADAAAAMQGVVKALHAAGIAERDIRTTTLSLQPVYQYLPNASPRITGYEMRNGVVATIRDLDKVAAAIDGALGAGGTTLDGITFRLDDSTGAEAQARTSAMKEARAKADALATAAGVSIVGVASIAETSAPTPWPVMYAAGAAKDAAVATPIAAGTSDVTVTVNVVYLIG